MTIESDLKKIEAHLGRIGDALEALLAERGYVPTSPTTVDDDKSKGKGKGKGKGKDKKTTVGKTKDDDDKGSDLELKDVRAALKELQETINQAAVKSLLKKYGASTLGQLSEKKYQRVIDDAKEQVEEADDD
jgi:hypothetical protein